MAEQLSFGLLILDPQAHRLQAMCKPRKCLSCQSTFDSSGPGNRICTNCKGRDAWSSSPDAFAIHSAF
jgi:hypothetical protein